MFFSSHHLFPITSFLGFTFFLFFATLRPVHAAVVINEMLPKTADAQHQWIELYNSGSEPVSLDRWQLENTSGEKKTFILNASSIIQGQSFLIFFGSQTGIIMSLQGDTIRLLNENNTVMDSQTYEGILGYNVTIGRSTDGGGSWSTCTTDTPNKPNDCPPIPTNTPLPPTAIPTPLPTATPTPLPMPTDIPFSTPLPVTPSPAPSLIVQATSTPTPSATIPANTGKMLIGAGLTLASVWGIIIGVYLRHRKK